MINSTEFMVFELHKEQTKNELAYLLVYLFNQFHVFSYMRLQPETLFNFANKVSKMYLDNPYHNKIHSFDVTQVKIIYLY